jgi:CubicO group peptidase (beta-lactamase class C family)
MRGMSVKRILAATIVAVPSVLLAQAAATKPDVDTVFARYSKSTPGCAVGVEQNGVPTLAKGYGMADLEHDVPITPDTIFEAGSVTKQFTAAAVLLLARDGKLSIDDPVRKYIPELPDYEKTGAPASPQTDGGPLLIRHMLNHTSGLRDWGGVASIAGWPRTTRVHTHAHVLEIVSHQQSLNFPPGSNWSYSNTGFNLAAILVSRVSGQSFPTFTAERIFKPLGMSHTSWRDDYTRIVKNRAIAYLEDREHKGEFKTDMPFENVYGNGGLLTTVGDLLKWNENFDEPVVGDRAFVELQQQPGKFNDGRTHGYAFGLYVGNREGLREVYHSGSTAGYSAFLTRFPDQKLSIAVLCNVATNATALAHGVADQYLGITTRAPMATYTVTDADISRLVGMYRNIALGGAQTIVRGENGNGLRIENGPLLLATAPNQFVLPTGARLSFDGNGKGTVTDEFGTVEHLERLPRANPPATELSAYEGVYASSEAEVELRAAVENGQLVLKRRPATTIVLTPLYADAFSAPGLGTIVFRRDTNQRPIEFVVSQERVWALRFGRKEKEGIGTKN